MKEKFLQIPQPLRKQILLRCAGAGIGIGMLLFVLAYSRDWRFFIPCIAVVIISLANAAFLFYRCVQGRYVVIHGECTEIERTGIRKRIKAIYLQTQEHPVKLTGVKAVRNLTVGDSVELYVADNTPVYSMEGWNVICNYITLIRSLPAAKKEIRRK